jgi:mono/diheme cytochrome c family protein
VLLAVTLAGVGIGAGFLGAFFGGRPPPAPELDPQIVAAGRLIYDSNCATDCHGGMGEGQAGWQTPNPNGARGAPPHNSTGHTWMHSDLELFRTVRDGLPPHERTGADSEMLPFTDELTPEEIRAVITYLKSLWTDEQRAYQARESLQHPFR